MLFYFTMQTMLVFNHISYSQTIGNLGYTCFLLFIPFFLIVILEYIRRSKQSEKDHKIRIQEIEKFIDDAALISKANEKGKITYVNKKFTEVSGYTLDDVIGKDHSIVNSGYHPSEMWSDMYNVVIKEKGIWNKIVTNKGKSGNLYYVDTYIKAEFDSKTNKLKGFTSIRQDVTELKRKETEIRNRMNAINKSNAVIEFDLNGKIIFANKLFCNTMEYSESELVGRYHKIFVGEEFLFSNSRSKEYKEFWKKLKSGEFVSGEFERTTKSGRNIWLQASYNPIVDDSGNVYKIMKIATDITERVEQSDEIEKKNTYLEHAAKILRHDMHSGINTYIPRGVSSLERRLTEDDIKNLKIEAPLKMIKEGLKHTQKVYKGVYEFTNLVKKDVVLTRSECNIKSILDDYLSSTSYKSQVILDSNLPTINVNESLFCTSIDNLIRNGLKYNDNDTKFVKIYSEDEYICIVDNGRGMTQEDFIHLSKPYVRKEGQKESGTGLGLNICIAILKEHGFLIVSEKIPEGGTKIKIKII
jgi:PAS domain S-box-containing protein